MDEKSISRSKKETENFIWAKFEADNLGRASQKALGTVLPSRSQGIVIQGFWDRGLYIKWRIIDSLHDQDLSIITVGHVWPRRRSRRNVIFLIYLFIYLFIYSFLAVLGLHFCARAFSSCGKWGPLFIAVRGPLTTAASLVAEHRLQTRRLSSCGSRA